MRGAAEPYGLSPRTRSGRLLSPPDDRQSDPPIFRLSPRSRAKSPLLSPPGADADAGAGEGDGLVARLMGAFWRRAASAPQPASSLDAHYTLSDGQPTHEPRAFVIKEGVGCSDTTPVAQQDDEGRGEKGYLASLMSYMPFAPAHGSEQAHAEHAQREQSIVPDKDSTPPRSPVSTMGSFLQSCATTAATDPAPVEPLHQVALTKPTDGSPLGLSVDEALAVEVVREGSPAAEAGLRSYIGWRVVQCNRKLVLTPRQMAEVIAGCGGTVHLALEPPPPPVRRAPVAVQPPTIHATPPPPTPPTVRTVGDLADSPYGRHAAAPRWTSPGHCSSTNTHSPTKWEVPADPVSYTVISVVPVA
eukprot:TRINITY_DN17808_c0_g1_i1.p1 TRINITY_DN17808_c0_g1~~TRINITY_DN17808_c0_g1_i1.p1  ORF type:complete len:359 (+),score=61.99 TRINITY_DN17808_c0_g1_i1:64-1140(+)